MAENVTHYKAMSTGLGSIRVMAKPDTSASPSAVFAAMEKLGITHVVSLLETNEAKALGLQNEATLCASNNIGFINFPIEDMSLPSDFDAFVAIADELHRMAKIGAQIVIHCRAGIGRSGMLACAVVMNEKINSSKAIKIVANARGLDIPDTAEQRDFIHLLDERLQTL